ncbi:pilus assembly PilX family protein [Novilysobacter defluvii]|uniref:Pilus assembly protein n=1 Tax=Lysobacter defluvii IMMIB APB-9 = DSM 18482 TaxID=1385515 RepID=A0A0A0M8I8_9GAMM|nr:pilus assembly protein [Lysobacter defluvii]KGO99390.1 pilus assembly protein [Lysobacter defluvii IMMIB APB-9 = DSM 18482]
MKHIVRGVRRHQRGAVLIVVLVLLLAMTVLGMLSLRGALMEERMGAGMYDRSLAFQAAEAALREAEQRLMAPGVLADFPTTADTCNNGLCATPAPAEGKLDRSDDPAFNGWTNATQVDGVAGTPQYFIENMGEAPGWPGCHLQSPVHPTCIRQRYRITARSSNDDRAAVILQTSFAG